MNGHSNGDTLLYNRIAAMFVAALHVDPPGADADLFETGVLDSVSFVDLLLRIEQEFGIHCSLEDLDLDNFRSVNRIAGFINRGGKPPTVPV